MGILSLQQMKMKRTIYTRGENKILISHVMLHFEEEKIKVKMYRLCFMLYREKWL